MNGKTLITGFPRIGEKRELKKALESYWSGKSSVSELEKTAAELRKKHWLIQKNKGIDFISCNDFSLYDNMLDTIVMLNAIPERFKKLENKTDIYFAMARGYDKGAAMEMTKWFNTNYHYIVPELDKTIEFSLDSTKIISEYNEAKSLGINPKINLIGPVTFLGLSKTTDGNDTYDYFEKIIKVYEELLRRLSALDKEIYVQMEEPVFVKDPSVKQLELLGITYNRLGKISPDIKIIVTTYFEHSNEATAVLSKTPVWGLGLDFVHGADNTKSLDYIKDKKLIAGVVDGRNIWINDIDKTVNLLNTISQKVKKEQIIISTSCSLLHVPFTITDEKENEINKWISFASEKADEIVLAGKLFASPDKLTEADKDQLDKNRTAVKERKSSGVITKRTVLERIKNIKKTERDGRSEERMAVQKGAFALPLLPTTTIGSFPQTPEIRKLRRDYKIGAITLQQYEEQIKKYIDKCISFQEEAGLDVLVHGEFERNDMVEYFGEMLEGFHFTTNGWVQSYGSRCVKPPVIYGDVSRPDPMTVKWITYAQGKTNKPMKGMLTGPVTILNWSFVRDDMARSDVSRQIAVSLSDEIDDLQLSGIRIVQVDEAAFKEGYPLRKNNIAGYEKWAVDNFKLAVSKAKKETQIHTHMCYSDFNSIIKTIEKMDADVITIETARSGNKLLKVFQQINYRNQVGPGVYDIHSPRIPSVEEFTDQILSRTEVFPIEKLWINPDCGLKTRKWEEVRPALANMVEAVKKVRSMKS